MQKLKQKYDREGVQYVQEESDIGKEPMEKQHQDPDRFNPMHGNKHGMRVQNAGKAGSRSAQYTDPNNPYANMAKQFSPSLGNVNQDEYVPRDMRGRR